VQRPPALLWPPPLQRRWLRAPCSLVEQGAGAPTAPRAPRRWGWTTTSSGLPHCVPLAFVPVTPDFP
jgi:hypothetical protein